MIKVLGKGEVQNSGEFWGKFQGMYQGVSEGIRTGLGVVPGTSGGFRGIKVASGGLWLQVVSGSRQ